MTGRIASSLAFGLLSCFVQSRAAVIAIVVEQAPGKPERPLSGATVVTDVCGPTTSEPETGEVRFDSCKGRAVSILAQKEGYRPLSGAQSILLGQQPIKLILIPNGPSPGVGDASRQLAHHKVSGPVEQGPPAIPVAGSDVVVDAGWLESAGVTTLSVTVNTKRASPVRGVVRALTLYVSKSWTLRHAIAPLPEASQAIERELVLAEPKDFTYAFPIPVDGTPIGTRISRTVGVLSRFPIYDWIFSVQVEANVENGGRTVAAVRSQPFLLFVTGQRRAPRNMCTLPRSAVQLVEKSRSLLASIPHDLRYYASISDRLLNEFMRLKLEEIPPGETLPELAEGTQPGGDANDGVDTHAFSISPSAPTDGPVLVIAAARGNAGTIKLLRSHGAQFAVDGTPVRSPDGDTPFIRAARYNNTTALEALLEGLGPLDPSTDVLDVATYEGETALTLAARGKNLESVKLLLDRGFKHGILSEPRRSMPPFSVRETALIRAVRAGCDNQQVVEELLQNGSKPDQRTEENQTALTLASAQGCASMVERLLKKESALPSIPEAWRAAWSNEASASLEVLLRSASFHEMLKNDKSLRTSVRDLFGSGVASDKTFAIDLLIRMGPDAYFDDVKLHSFGAAVANGAEQAVARMLASGNPFVAFAAYEDPKDGLSWISVAVNKGWPAIVRLLQKYGVTAKAPKGSVVAAVRADERRLEHLEAALLAGGNPNELDDDRGYPALMWAVGSGYRTLASRIADDKPEDLIRMLMIHCADPALKDRSSRSVLDMPFSAENTRANIEVARLVKLIREFPRPADCVAHAGTPQ
jgi:ankyrin repeat protein